jgi:hypothetical protein
VPVKGRRNDPTRPKWTQQGEVQPKKSDFVLAITPCRGKAPWHTDWPTLMWTPRTIEAAYKLNATATRKLSAKLLRRLVDDGVLEVGEVGTTFQARRYRYRGD